MPVQSTYIDEPIKIKMLARLASNGDCRERSDQSNTASNALTEQDCQELVDQTYITLAEIKQWTSHFQFRCKNLTESEIMAYLRKEPKVNKFFE